jgi:hypothetical protein
MRIFVAPCFLIRNRTNNNLTVCTRTDRLCVELRRFAGDGWSTRRMQCRLVSTWQILVRAKKTLQLDSGRISATRECRCCRL